MKNAIQLLFLSIFSMVLVSSCTIQKRLHTGGYNVTWNQNWKKQKNISQQQDKYVAAPIEKEVAENFKENSHSEIVNTTFNTSKTNTVETVNIAHVESTRKSTPIKNDIATTSNQLTNTKSDIHTAKTYKQIKNDMQDMKVSAQSNKKVDLNRNNSSSSAGGTFSGGMLVLMIILCLFPLINLIPVWMHDGKSITLNFWITLVLALILIGSVIFSLLVVLDVVDLA